MIINGNGKSTIDTETLEDFINDGYFESRVSGVEGTSDHTNNVKLVHFLVEEYVRPLLRFSESHSG